MSTLNLVQGWTGQLDFRLDADGSAYDLTGKTVAIVMSRFDGTAVSLSGTVSTVSATGGQVRFTPSTGDLTKGSYRVRWKVTDGSSRNVFFPNGDPDTWKVYHP